MNAPQGIFKGCQIVKNGYFYVNEAPDWRIEVGGAAAKDGEVRKRDGTLVKQ